MTLLSINKDQKLFKYLYRLICIQILISLVYISAKQHIKNPNENQEINFRNELPVYKHQDLLTVCLMVKNEEKNIIQTLKPFVLANIKSFLIYDTGSTDATKKYAKNFLSKYKSLKFVIIQENFIDFSTSRNRAIRLTEKHFKNNKFILMPDAEWYISNASKLQNLCKNLEKSIYDCFLIKITDNKVDFYVPRLFRAHRNIKFIGSVHEIPNKSTGYKLPEHIYFKYSPTNQSKSRSKQRWSRDKYLLLRDHKKDPNNPRTLFFLAQTYANLGDWQNARYYFEKRTKVNGNREENFIAVYRLAQVTENLCYKSTGKNRLIYWQEALDLYLQAYNKRPTRAEPLYELSRLYLNNNQPEIANIFIKKACKIAYPKNDVIFVDKLMYGTNRFKLRQRIKEKLVTKN